jgi:hypothetical protein
MITVNEKLLNISGYLQTLASNQYASQVQETAEKQDKKGLAKVCKKAKIPAFYIPSIVSIIMSIQPQKWPAEI